MHWRRRPSRGPSRCRLRHARQCCAAIPRWRRFCASPARKAPTPRRSRAMPSFDYAALDRAGRTVTGVVEAPGADDARARLEQRRLVPLQVEPTAGRRTASPRPARIRPRELSLATRQLSSLVASMTLEEALRTVGSQATRRNLREVMLAVHGEVVEGFRLSEAMGRQPRSFPALYRAKIGRASCRERVRW